jgi:chaperonin GroES
LREEYGIATSVVCAVVHSVDRTDALSSLRLTSSTCPVRPPVGDAFHLTGTLSRLLWSLPMTFRPLNDRLIVHRFPAPDIAHSAIVIPDSAKEKPQQGTVIAAGLGKGDKDGHRIPLDVKAGDTILFGKYSGQEITLDGIDYLILKEDDVLGISEGRA